MQSAPSEKPSSRSTALLPIALGFLVISRGDYRDAVLGAVNYGRDADSIASMAGALAGALNGIDAVPAEWRQGVASASRRDIEAPGRVMAAVAREVFAEDKRRRRAAEAAFEELVVEGRRAADLDTA